MPYPDLMLFDCPDANSAAVQRSVSNTPLQALAVLNSETSLTAARGLARRMGEVGDAEPLLTWAFRTCLARPPTAAELARLSAVLDAHRVWYAGHPEDAAVLAGDLPAEAAPLVATANVILNLDEFLTRE